MSCCFSSGANALKSMSAITALSPGLLEGCSLQGVPNCKLVQLLQTSSSKRRAAEQHCLNDGCDGTVNPDSTGLEKKAARSPGPKDRRDQLSMVFDANNNHE
mmetsp:Transcript_17303/g.45342  ORF Transcript_17303/g.45342 Transcript_17303/m.45342 type:complete len:102 (-) Transcript_17303:39-344(-)